MPIMITPAQLLALEAQQMRTFAAEVARTLGPILAAHRSPPVTGPTEQFAHEQLEQARMLGLKRKNEMMAWTLCALVHGAGFEHRLPEAREIVAERNYDRSTLLTLLAMHGLRNAGQAT